MLTRRPSAFASTAVAQAILLLPLGSCSTEPSELKIANEDFCSDPRIVQEMQRQDPKLQPAKPWCSASSIAFRDDGNVQDIAVAQVSRGIAQSGDMLWGVDDSIIRLPDDRLVNLGPNAPLPVPNKLLVHLMEALNISATQPQAHAILKFYSDFLEPTKRGYCVTYEMNPPFEGQLNQCSSLEPFSGDVSYMPGATDWQEAHEAACGLVPSGSDDCSVLSMNLETGAQGQLQYVVEVRFRSPAAYNTTYQRSFYLIDVMTGVASPRGQ